MNKIKISSKHPHQQHFFLHFFISSFLPFLSSDSWIEQKQKKKQDGSRELLKSVLEEE